jgi:hypothetical protein
MRAIALICLAACGGAPPARPASTFAADAEAFYWAYYDRAPKEATILGWHRYDGRLPDVSPTALAAWGATMARAEATLAAHAPATLTPTERLEREVMLRKIAGERFGLERLRTPWRVPMWYLEALELTYYVSRDYAPLAERARAAAAIARGTRAFLRQADVNLARRMPRTWIATTRLMVDGTRSFLAKDVPAAFAGLADVRELDSALADMDGALDEFGRAVAAREPTDDFALGETDFLDFLAATEGERFDLATLERTADAALARDGDALVAAARAVDPRADVATVVSRLPRPPVDGMVAAAERQAAEMRRFLVDKDIVSIPSDDPAEVRETPPFMRWNGAFLDPSGPFEPRPLPSFYFITPPEPEWPRAKQIAFVPSEPDLLFTTIHEVWPGHFLHKLHIDKSPSRILRSFCSYQMSEGWAHYAEEMMWDAGVGRGDARVHIGQLENALLRDARFASALGLHARGMSVAASAALFRDRAFTGEDVGVQQAVRGTFDPLYLNYTLGKLIIAKLRADWQKRTGGSLKAFHDAFLGYACAPLPAIRRAMMGEEGELL